MDWQCICLGFEDQIFQIWSPFSTFSEDNSYLKKSLWEVRSTLVLPLRKTNRKLCSLTLSLSLSWPDPAASLHTRDESVLKIGEYYFIINLTSQNISSCRLIASRGDRVEVWLYLCSAGQVSSQPVWPRTLLSPLATSRLPRVRVSCCLVSTGYIGHIRLGPLLHQPTPPWLREK